MNCQGWSRRGGFRLFARQGRTGDTAATGLLAGRPRIVAGHNNPTSTHGRQNFNYQNRMLTRPQIWAGRADDTVAGDLLCLWHQG